MDALEADDLFDAFEADKEDENAGASTANGKETGAKGALGTERGAGLKDSTRQREAAEQPVPKKRARLDVVAEAPALRGDSAAKDGERPTGKTCKHEVAMPPGMGEADEGMLSLAYDASRPPARTYAFELDPFQKAAVAAIEREESVLVSAHTSAGKTVCAEYAIAVSLRDKQRVIYTSPIKALSNQKYRELTETFGDVGLMTGDYTINVDASCLVMTTEILRSMLYRGSEVMREVKWVVFDEVHYMGDKERGVVWEEVMILLPHSVRYVFLSATVPNALQFAEWIAQLHSQPCHVVYTEYRPTPLQHYLFGAGSDGFHLVVDEKSSFKPAAFDKAATSIKARTRPKDDRGGKGGGGRGGGGRGDRRGSSEPSDCFKLVRTVVARGMDPLIVFAFGKRAVEGLAAQMGGLSDLTNADERASITQIFEDAIDTLSEDDKQLPQVSKMLPLLQRGIAVHHSGLLPLLKELVEILFQENLVKLLFATETFAMGLNMPAKTVIFADLSKFDGSQFRILSSGEYIQMSGRAGRRGLDERGTVITMIDEKTDLTQVKEMLCGEADRLSSRFHLSYNMLLNCVRVETADIEQLIAKSFYTFQLQKELPHLEAKQRALANALTSAEWRIDNEVLVAELNALLVAEKGLRAELRTHTTEPMYVLPFLQTGRLARIVGKPPPTADADADFDDTPEAQPPSSSLSPSSPSSSPSQIPFGWGVLVSFRRSDGGARPSASVASAKGGAGDASEYTVDMLLRCSPTAADDIAAGRSPSPPLNDDEAEMHVLNVPLKQIDALSSVKLSMPKDLKSGDGRFAVLKVVREVERRFPDGVPLIDPVSDMKVEHESVPKLMRKLEGLQSRLGEERLRDPALHANLPKLRQKLQMYEDERDLRRQIKAGRAVLMKDELKGMRRVLRRLGHVSEDGVIGNKGRVACEVSTSDELLITELVFTGIFQTLQPAELASLLSCFVAEQMASGDGKGGKGGGKGSGGGAEAVRTASMREPIEQLKQCARRIATVVQEAKLPVNVDEYVNRFSPAMVDLVFDWCGGTKFSQLMEGTDQYEGSVIRALHRLEELLRQLVDAAKVVGNAELEASCEDARKMLIRDVVFAQSLYT